MSAPAKVLVVDDTPNNVKLLFDLLSVKGYAVATATNGEEGLTKIASEKPDLVLLDVMMPGTDGPTTLQRMRADPRFANIPVVFVTAKAMPAEVARFRELGAVAVIAKPFDPLQFGQQIVAIWEGIDHGRA